MKNWGYLENKGFITCISEKVLASYNITFIFYTEQCKNWMQFLKFERAKTQRSFKNILNKKKQNVFLSSSKKGDIKMCHIDLKAWFSIIFIKNNVPKCVFF